MMVVTTGAMKYAKLQSKRHHQRTKTQIICLDALPVAQPTASALNGKKQMQHIS